MESIVTSSKRLIIARFDEDEDLLKSLKELAVKHNIKSAWFSVIGALKEFTYGLYEEGQYRTMNMKTRHCLELLPTYGNISIKDGDVLVHAHVATSDEEGHVFGGHLLEGSIIYPFVEVFMQECDAVIGRKYDSKTNLWTMKF